MFYTINIWILYEFLSILESPIYESLKFFLLKMDILSRYDICMLKNEPWIEFECSRIRVIIVIVF